MLRRLVLLVPGVVLAFAVLAPPAHADPEGPPTVGDAGRSGDAPGVTADLPAPEHAAAHEAVEPKSVPAAAPVAEPPASEPQGPPAGAPAAPAALDGPSADPKGEPASVDGPAPDASAAIDKPKGQKVVVCKYVRKPGVAETFSHIVVVNENALLGKGFAGVFPFAFSDAHTRSVAVRFAAKGEQAHGISASVCPADDPPGEEPPGEEPPGEEPPGDVGGISEEQSPAGARGAEVVLPNAGVRLPLQYLALLAGLCTLAGAWLVARGVRAQE